MGRKKKEESEEIKKPKAIGPFEIINMIFTDKDAFNSLSNLLLAKNFFMINRIFSIQFPLQAQCFNKMGIDNANVIRSWAQFTVSKLGYGRVPSFVFTKGAKKTAELKEVEVSKELKEAYCKFYKISFKDFDDMLYFNHDAALEHINNYAKVINPTEQLKNYQKI